MANCEIYCSLDPGSVEKDAPRVRLELRSLELRMILGEISISAEDFTTLLVTQRTLPCQIEFRRKAFGLLGKKLETRHLTIGLPTTLAVIGHHSCRVGTESYEAWAARVRFYLKEADGWVADMSNLHSYCTKLRMVATPTVEVDVRYTRYV